MKKATVTGWMLCGTVLLGACATSTEVVQESVLTEETKENPLASTFNTPYQIPPFDKIQYSHYMPAVMKAIEEHEREVSDIVENRDSADFENTILALDNSGQTLNNIYSVLDGLGYTDNNDSIQEVLREVVPYISAHGDEVSMDTSLFRRVKQVYDRREQLHLATDQERLLDRTYRGFVRGGALLSPDRQDTLKWINNAIAEAEMDFNVNLQNGNSETQIVVTDSSELTGIPQNAIDEAADLAREQGKEGTWIFTLYAPSRLAVLTNAENRSLRERMHKAYTSLCRLGDKNDNSVVINRLLRLRQQKARLLGYRNYADYSLDGAMAHDVASAHQLLMEIWGPAKNKVRMDVTEMQSYARRHGENITIEPWDYLYYAEKVKAEKFHFSEEDVRPYFVLDNVVKDGLFFLAERLYNIHFTEMPDAPKYHPDVRVYDLKDSTGQHLGVLMTDYFPRESKAPGAWMSSFKEAYGYNGANERPIVYNVGNFTKPTKDTPSLLTIDELQTAFHEFGHGLHGMLTTARFRSQSGTQVDRDMSEMPSQLNEHWATEPEMLRHFARHYKTGEVMPDSLIQKMTEATRYIMGYLTEGRVSSALLDLALHTTEIGDEDIDLVAFEEQLAKELDLPEEAGYQYRSTYFKHIFGCDEYAAAFYTYLWAAVLDTDGFEMFRQNGIFDAATAASYRHNILEPGDSEDPMVLYKRFRGQAPSVDALLRDRGLK